jgi:hypothetical protein
MRRAPEGVVIAGIGKQIKNARGANSPSASSVDEPENDQKQNRADSRRDDGGQDTEAKMDPQSGQ